MRVQAAVATVAVLVCAASVCAQVADSARATDPHAAAPERPTVATHAFTVAPGWVELEAGVEHDQRDGAHALLTPIVLKFGIAARAQLELLESFIHLSGSAPDYSGIGDLGAALKWRLLDDAPVLGHFAIQPSLKLPVGSARHGTGTGTTDAGVLLISSHNVGAYELDINAGYVRRSGDGTQAPRNATLWTVSGGGPVAGALGWVLEVYGYPRTTGPAGESGIVALLSGPTVQLRPWLVLDAGAIFPLAGAQPHALYAGLTWNIGRL